jgi:hypothetical protein
MRSLKGLVAGLIAAITAHAAAAAPLAPADHDIGKADTLLTRVHGIVYGSDVRYAHTYYGVHYVPWIQARRHWYYRHYRPAEAEPFKFYPYYFYTPRYIYTPHYAIQRSTYRRPRR